MRFLLTGVLAIILSTAVQAQEKVIRVGIIGLDTSHVTAFTKLLNEGKAHPELAGFKVVAGFPGGSPDIPASKDRIAGFTATLRDKFGVEIVNSIDELLQKVDVVLLESVDGRPHLEQVIPVFKAGKRVFIDKPLAGSLKDALKIADLSKQYKTPFFSSSSLRYYPGIAAAKTDPKVGDVIGAMVYGPCSLEPNHPDLFWYGIHGVEALYTIMGTGCESVSRSHTADTDVVTGQWKGGRLGTFRGVRKGNAGYGALVFGSKAVQPTPPGGGYDGLLVEIAKFFRTGVPPIAVEETLEMFAFMEAADESKRQGGAPVKIADVIAKARK